MLDIDVIHVDFADCERYGHTVDELVGDDYTATQAPDDAVRSDGAVTKVCGHGVVAMDGVNVVKPLGYSVGKGI